MKNFLLLAAFAAALASSRSALAHPEGAHSAISSHMAMHTPSQTPSSAKPLNVAFLVYPGVEALDLSGPLDVFIQTNDIAPHSYNVYTVSSQGRTVTTQSGALSLNARYTLQNCPRPDIIIVPGGSTEVSNNPRVIAWLKHNASPSQTIMSVCTGAFILGRAGLLDGKNSTSHWLVLDQFQRQFPKTRAYQGVTLAHDGNIVTAAGVSSGIEGALFLVERTKGKSVADAIARGIQYRRNMVSYPEAKPGRVVLQKLNIRKPGQKLASLRDPICGMPVDANTSYVASYEGKLYGFCSLDCQHEFEQHPTRYLKKPQ